MLRAVKEKWRACLLAGVLTAMATRLVQLPLDQVFEFLSIDCAFLVRPEVDCGEVVIIEMDQKSHEDLGQIPGERWDRQLHARLVTRLIEDRAPLIVFDILFTDDVDPAGTLSLANAIREHGRVVAVAGEELRLRKDVFIWESTSPVESIEEALAGMGSLAVLPDQDGVVRRLPLHSALVPSLAVQAAALAGAELTGVTNHTASTLWMRLYASGGDFSRISFSDALTAPPGHFRDKIVFVGGGRPDPGFVGVPADTFRTPLTRWAGGLSSGVELQAMAFLNLMQGAWASRLRGDFALLLGGAFIWGFLARALTPGMALGTAVGLALGLCLAGWLLFWTQGRWFPWLLGVAVTVPSGLVWSLVAQMHRLIRQRQAAPPDAGLESYALTVGDRQREVYGRNGLMTGEKTATAADTIVVADHQLLKRVGEGAYGEVWLARNAIGLHHAVKIVRRSAFSHPTPYEREFRGIQRFMPISRQHPNLVNVLHVGRNDSEHYFYYVMEMGDDESGQFPKDPQTYSPSNLAKVLRTRKRLPVAECLDVVIPLASALKYLHERELVHRDIKPSNIIFVDRVPKLADVGLVTDVAARGRAVTYLGTEGYIAPEGPGSPVADVFSLGKVLYEMSMGLDRLQYPNLPTAVVEHPEQEGVLLQLNDIILKACEPRPEDRLGSAAEFLERCQVLKQSISHANPGMPPSST